MTDQPRFILVEPQMGENIGAVARAMWNFGLDRLSIVNPRDGWPNSRAVAMSSGAARLLDEARLSQTTAEAVADCTHIYATTARPREMTKRVLTPEAAAAEMRAKIAVGERIGVLFGKERSGLENEDIVLANTIITVPVNPDFYSLNLAQCALLVGYEWFQAADATPAVQYDTGKSEIAAHENVGRWLDHLQSQLAESGFFWPEDKAPSMQAALRNLFHRAPLTEADLRMLWGVTRALSATRKSARR